MDSADDGRIRVEMRAHTIYLTTHIVCSRAFFDICESAAESAISNDKKISAVDAAELKLVQNSNIRFVRKSALIGGEIIKLS